MKFLLESGVSFLLLLAVLLLALELGRRIGTRRWREDREGADKGTGAVEGAVFGLMGLLIAFVFSGTVSRFEKRQDLILREANAISTAWLRLDLLAERAAEELRGELRRYTDLRIAETRRNADTPSAEVGALQRKIWTTAVGASRGTSEEVRELVLPALNEMFDLATARYVVVTMHSSSIVYALLLLTAVLCSLLAGYGMAGAKTRSWLHVVCFTLNLVAAIYVIIDIEFPRAGAIQVAKMDQVMVDTRNAME